MFKESGFDGATCLTDVAARARILYTPLDDRGCRESFGQGNQQKVHTIKVSFNHNALCSVTFYADKYDKKQNKTKQTSNTFRSLFKHAPGDQADINNQKYNTQNGNTNNNDPGQILLLEQLLRYYLLNVITKYYKKKEKETNISYLAVSFWCVCDANNSQSGGRSQRPESYQRPFQRLLVSQGRLVCRRSSGRNTKGALYLFLVWLIGLERDRELVLIG